ncbi:MAG: hypothetical protein RLZZ468_1033 [Cyanobacteriota bacterium]
MPRVRSQLAIQAPPELLEAVAQLQAQPRRSAERVTPAHPFG